MRFEGQKRGAAALGHGAEQTAMLQGRGVGAVDKRKADYLYSFVLHVNIKVFRVTKKLYTLVFFMILNDGTDKSLTWS